MKIGQRVRIKAEGTIDVLPFGVVKTAKVRFPVEPGGDPNARWARFLPDELELLPMPTLKERVVALRERPGTGVYHGEWIKADAVLDLLKEFGVEDA